MPSMFDTTTHAEIIDRIHRLRPDAERRWGQMTSSQMVAHLSDQMRHTLSEATAASLPGYLRNPLGGPVCCFRPSW